MTYNFWGRKLCSVTALHSRFVDTLSYAEGSSEELSAVNVINMTSYSCPASTDKAKDYSRSLAD